MRWDDFAWLFLNEKIKKQQTTGNGQPAAGYLPEVKSIAFSALRIRFMREEAKRG